MSQQLIEKIVAAEWSMFQEVNSGGERADCQNDYPGFVLNRTSQFKAWNEAALERYAADLESAQSAGRNLVFEKYAHMMASTAPQQYAALEPALHMPTEEEKQLAGEICAILMRHTQAYAAKYPYVAGKGRPIHSDGDSSETTSMETYQLGELYTYSLSTLQCLHAHLLSLEEQGENFAETVMRHTALASGYPTLEAAEEAAAKETQESMRLVPNFGCPCCGQGGQSC